MEKTLLAGSYDKGSDLQLKLHWNSDREEWEIFQSTLLAAFYYCVSNIAAHVEDTLSRLTEPIEYLLLVGGLGSNSLLKSVVKSTVSNNSNIKVIQPANSNSVKGAVLFGLNPSSLI